MTTFKVRKEVWPYLQKYLDQDQIRYEKVSDTSVSADISGTKFHRLVKNAVCEKERLEGEHPELLVLSQEVILNDRALFKVLSDYQTDTFTVLKSEQAKILRELKNRKRVLLLPERHLKQMLSEEGDTLDPKRPVFRLTKTDGMAVGYYREKNVLVLCQCILTVAIDDEIFYQPIR